MSTKEECLQEACPQVIPSRHRHLRLLEEGELSVSGSGKGGSAGVRTPLPRSVPSYNHLKLLQRRSLACPRGKQSLFLIPGEPTEA